MGGFCHWGNCNNKPLIAWLRGRGLTMAGQDLALCYDPVRSPVTGPQVFKSYQDWHLTSSGIAQHLIQPIGFHQANVQVRGTLGVGAEDHQSSSSDQGIEGLVSCLTEGGGSWSPGFEREGGQGRRIPAS